MSKTLHLAKGLVLPADAVTQTFAIFGKRGSGKTNGATVLVEELLKAHLPVVILDPVDAWWGLKASFDGKGPGFPIYVFGGVHGDLPLEPSAGALIADVVAHERLPMILSMKTWGVAERARFVTDFAKRLLQVNSEPVMMVLEEADAFIPQRPAKGEEAMLGAMDRLVRWGRGSGVGCTIVTQRSAKVNKDVTTQAETLIAFRTTGPQDRDAIDGWIKHHAGDERREEVLSTLPALPTGTAWVWSPEWLEFFGRAAFRRRATFDSAATPKVGQKVRPPKELAAVDLEQLRTQMAETVEKAKADDPRELRKTIAELKKQLAAKQPLVANKQQPVERVVEKFVLKDGQLVRTEKILDHIEKLHAGFRLQLEGLSFAGKELAAAIAKTREPLKPLILAGRRDEATSRAVSVPRSRADLGSRVRQSSIVMGPVADDARLVTGRGLKKHVVAILTALAQHPSGLTREQTLILAGYQPSGDISTAFAALLEHFLIHQGGATGGGRLWITPAAEKQFGPFDPLPIGSELRAHLLNGSKLESAERKMLSALFQVWPNAAPRAELHDLAGLKPSGDTSSALAKFLKLGWALERDRALVAADTFFEGDGA